LFDFEEENRIFESPADDSAYMKLQLERLGIAAQTGVAFPLVKKLLAFNEAGEQRVEVVILLAMIQSVACEFSALPNITAFI
jgi:5'-nucleotidase